jgi:hypothetical protein
MVLFMLAILTLTIIMPWVIIATWNEDCPQYEEEDDRWTN